MFLGADLHLDECVAPPTEERVRNLIECASMLMNAHTAPAMVWLKVLGLMASMVDLVPWCRYNMRPIQIYLYCTIIDRPYTAWTSKSQCRH